MVNSLKRYRKIMVILIIIFLLLMISNTIYATDSIIQGADDFLDKGNKATLNSESVKKASDMVYNAFLAVGTVIVVIVGAVLGIQFIMGSVEEKAKIQEALIPYIIGSVIIFGSFAIWKVAVISLSGINKGSSTVQQSTGGTSGTIGGSGIVSGQPGTIIHPMTK